MQANRFYSNKLTETNYANSGYIVTLLRSNLLNLGKLKQLLDWISITHQCDGSTYIRLKFHLGINSDILKE